ncbi:MAG: molybdopterin-dependent oxidoreductase [Candidatus Hodarchaeota archaeon]
MRKKFFCSICDASCGLIAVIEKGKVKNILPDKNHPVSKGYCCPKGLALVDITNDPDRILSPMKYRGDEWIKISWKQAITEISDELFRLKNQFGPNSISMHLGTNATHCFSTSMFGKGLMDAIGSENRYNAGSVDDNNKFAAQYFLFGNSVLMPIPDLVHTNYLILIGTNPAATNLSLAKCSNVMDKIKKVASRGKVIVIDPRRNETVKQLENNNKNSVVHHFIHPGTDTWLLMAMIHVIIREKLVDGDFLKDNTIGYSELEPLVDYFTPDLAASRTKIPKDVIIDIAREFASADRAVIYGRLGTCLTSHSTINAWAIEVLNIITGHFDKKGCAIFGYAPLNVAKIGKLIKLGEYDQWRSRIGNYAEVMNGLPLSVLAREMCTPGKGQVKAFIEIAGNVALTAPNSNELLEAMKNLDIVVNVDFYLNETAVAAAEIAKVSNNYFLPATTPLERANIHLTHLNYNVIPHVEYHDPVIETRSNGPKQEWKIFLALIKKMKLTAFGNKAFNAMMKILNFLNKELDPSFLVSLLAIIGNIMEKRFPLLSRSAITFKNIKEKKLFVWKHHEYSVLRKFLLTKDKKIHLLEKPILDAISRFSKQVDGKDEYLPLEKDQFLLIGRRHLKTMNSWMHNIPRLWKINDYPKLLLNKNDAKRLDLDDGCNVKLTTKHGEIEVPIKITGDIMRGVVCYPHGWGHSRNLLNHAKKHPGQNYNRLTSSREIEALSGMPRLNGIRVTLSRPSE